MSTLQEQVNENTTKINSITSNTKKISELSEKFNIDGTEEIPIGGEQKITAQSIIDIAVAESADTKTFFSVESKTDLTIPDKATPTFILNLAQINGLNGFTIDAATGSVINTSGRTLTMRGTLAIQYLHTGTTATDFFIYSESSADGITWVKNADSLRKFRIAKDGEDYKTIAAFTETGWTDGTYVRYMFSKTGGAMNLANLSETFGADTIEGHSFFWTMKEQ